MRTAFSNVIQIQIPQKNTSSKGGTPFKYRPLTVCVRTLGGPGEGRGIQPGRKKFSPNIALISLRYVCCVQKCLPLGGGGGVAKQPKLVGVWSGWW